MSADGSVTIDINVNGKQATVTLDDFKQKLNGLDAPAQRVDTGIKNIVTSLGLMKVASMAVNTLKSSLEGAIARYDTLNNYPKVMQSLGYSAEDAAKSTNKLKDGIQGLPTTLDSIVNNTQMLVSSMGDLDKATDLSLALNNMFLASGKGAEEANRAFTQFTQMLSKGKVDMQSWQTMMEVAPGQLNQVAKSMLGADANARTLYSALQDGTVTFDQFVDEIIKANSGLGGFEEQARNATGGIATSMTNVKTAFKNGLEGIIRAIDEWLAANNLPTIAGMLNNLKSTVNDVFKSIAGSVSTVMPIIVGFVKAIKEIAPALIAIGTAAFSIDLVTGAMTKLQSAIGVIEAIPSKVNDIKKTFETTKEAVKVFGSEMSVLFKSIAAGGEGFTGLIGALGAAAPYIAIVTAAVVVLVEAFQHLWETNESFRTAITEIWDGIKAKFEEFTQGIVDRLNALGFDFQNITEVLKAIWDGFCNFLAPVFEGAFNYISIVLGTVLDVLTGLLDIFIGLFSGNWDQFLNGIKGVFEGIWNGITGFIGNIFKTIMEIFDVALGYLGTSWSEIWTSVKNFFVGTWSSIVSFVTETIPNMINNIVNWFAELPGRIWQWLVDCVNRVASWGSMMWSKASSAASDLVNGFINTIASLPGRLYDWGVDAVNNFVQGIKDMIGWVIDAASDIASTIASYLHFSEPDIGPLSNASTFMPDMMKLYAKGMKDNIPMLQKAVSAVADSLVIPDINAKAEYSASAGYPSMLTNNSNSNVNIVFNGGITWSGESDIEATMDQIQSVISRRGYRLG